MHNFSRNKQTEQIEAHAFIVYTFYTFLMGLMFSFKYCVRLSILLGT